MDTGITVTWQNLLTLGNLLVTLGAVIGVIKKFGEPRRKIENRIANIEKNMESRMSKVEQYLENDYKKLATAASVHKTVLEVLVLILDHMIDGNNIDKMKKTREMLQSRILNTWGNNSDTDDD